MFQNSSHDFFAISDSIFTSVKYRVSGRIPKDWCLKEVPPGSKLSGYYWIAGFAPPVSTNDPIITLRYYGEVGDLDSLVKLVTKGKKQISQTSEHRISGIDMREIAYSDLSMKVLVFLYQRDGTGYGIELWSKHIENYRTLFDRFIQALIWIPKSLKEYIPNQDKTINQFVNGEEEWTKRIINGAKANSDFYEILCQIEDFSNKSIVTGNIEYARIHSQRCDDIAMLICDKGGDPNEIAGWLSYAASGLLRKVEIEKKLMRGTEMTDKNYEQKARSGPIKSLGGLIMIGGGYLGYYLGHSVGWIVGGFLGAGSIVLILISKFFPDALSK